MAAKSFSISFDQATDTPLKIVPKNTWVKINNFKNPCRLLEISPQSLTLDVRNEPETLTLHAGQNIKIQLLNIAEEKEKPFELHVTIFYINDSECLCQIPLFVNNEQILVDKIILEIQKNEIGIKNNSARKNKSADSDENAAPLIPTDENIAPILNNLIAMLPNETKGTDEHVTASKLTFPSFLMTLIIFLMLRKKMSRKKNTKKKALLPASGLLSIHWHCFVIPLSINFCLIILPIHIRKKPKKLKLNSLILTRSIKTNLSVMLLITQQEKMPAKRKK